MKQSFYLKSFICKINLGQGRILGQGHVQGHDRGQDQCLCVCGCIWLRQMVNVCVCGCIWLRHMSLLTAPMAPLAD